jgi:hypothetical protein
MVVRLGRIAIACVAIVAIFGAAAMSQDDIPPALRKQFDELYPFIDQHAAPPGQWRSNESGLGQSWSGKMGWRTRHGDAVVMWSLGKPALVWNALLPDGTVTKAQATMGSPSPWRYQLPGEPRRWMHGTVDIGPDRVTFVPGQQPTYEPPPANDIPDLEVDLAQHGELRRRLANERFADVLYAYLKNGEFWKEGGEQICLIGLSSGGGLVANLRGHGDTYIDYYPRGGEGPVTETMRQARRSLGAPEMSPEEAAVQEQKLAWFSEITEILRTIGWRRATAEDKAAAAAFTRRDLALWEQRPEASRPEWAQRFVEPKAQGLRVVRQGLREKMTEQQRREHDELVSGTLEKRLYHLAVSGRISQPEWRSMSARIARVPRDFFVVDPDLVKR